MKHGLSLWHSSFSLKFCIDSQTCWPTWNLECCCLWQSPGSFAFDCGNHGNRGGCLPRMHWNGASPVVKCVREFWAHSAHGRNSFHRCCSWLQYDHGYRPISIQLWVVAQTETDIEPHRCVQNALQTWDVNWGPWSNTMSSGSMGASWVILWQFPWLQAGPSVAPVDRLWKIDWSPPESCCIIPSPGGQRWNQPGSLGDRQGLQNSSGELMAHLRVGADGTWLYIFHYVLGKGGPPEPVCYWSHATVVLRMPGWPKLDASYTYCNTLGHSEMIT